MQENAPDFELLRQETAAYFERCEQEGSFPDAAGLRLALGLSQMEMEQLEGLPQGRRLLSEARDRRESWLVRAMVSDKGRTQGCMNALKQRENGGYGGETADRPLVLVLDGIPGGMSAFE